MSLVISPRSFTIERDEEISYTLDMVTYLGTNIVSTHAMTITSSDGSDVTTAIAGGSSESSGILSFGIKGASTGNYEANFTVTCVQVLPDGITPMEFIVHIPFEIE